MKDKKYRASPEYPMPNSTLYKSIYSSGKEGEKGKEEKKRLKVFTKMAADPSTTLKKIEEKLKPIEISKEAPRDLEGNKADESQRKSLSKERKNVKPFPSQEPRSPEMSGKRRPLKMSSVSQSFDNFNSDQKYETDQRRVMHHQSPNHELNQSFNVNDQFATQHLTPAHFHNQYSGFNLSQNMQMQKSNITNKPEGF